jgi:hypothetical protein
MFFERYNHSFPIRHLCRKQLIRDHLDREMLLEEYFFAEGSQKKVSTESKQITKTEKTPLNAFEHLKEALIVWQPTLNFGWLIPRYREIKFCFDYVENSTYYNVMPIDRPPYGEDVLRMIEAFSNYSVNVHDPIKPIDWLTGEPPTLEQLKATRKEIYELRCSDRFRFYINPDNY